MARGVLNAVLEHLLRPFQKRESAALTDGQLLERFLREREDAVFATLVERHAAMVMAVARRVLGNAHEAEDVFQATFFVLARKAGSIYRRPALGGWLYQIAYHLALKAGAKNARRRAAEGKVVTMVRATPDTSLDSTELRAVLDQELSRLPEKYRTPLILHYLEGKSITETALQLGWPQGTVSGRLAQARELLRNRLVRRGLVLSSAALTTLLAESVATAAVATALASATVHGALAFAQGLTTASAVSASAVNLAKGMVQGMLLAKIKTMVALVVVASVVAAGAGTVGYRALGAKAREEGLTQPDPVKQQAKPPVAEPEKAQMAKDQPAAPDEDAPRFSAAGKVVDADGNPIAEATIHLREQPRSWTSVNWHLTKTNNVARVNTNGQGRFEFEMIKLPPASGPGAAKSYPLDIVVVAKGYAISWKHLLGAASNYDLSFALQRESTIQGRLVDQDNKPVSKVPVRALQIMALTDGPRPSFSSKSRPDPAAPTFLDLEFSEVSLVAETDADGRFLLGNLPPNIRVDLLIADDHILPKEIYAATTDKAQAKLVDFVAKNQGAKTALREEIVYTNNFTLSLEPGTRIHGRIVYQDTGKPAVKARVAGWISTPEPYIEADADGRFSITQLPLRPWGALQIYPPEGTDYLGDSVQYKLTSENRVVEAKLELRRGVPITGKVVDEQTGKGIRGVVIYHLPATPEHQKLEPHYWRTTTKADGSFRIMVAPGKGHLIIPGAPDGYIAGNVRGGQSMREADARYNREIDLTEGQPLKDVTFGLGRGLTISGQVVDAGGKPLPTVQVDTVVPSGISSFAPLHVSTDSEGKFLLSALNAGEDYRVRFRNKEGTLGAALVIPLPAGQKNVEVQVKLVPTASLAGRVVDEDQQPCAAAKVLAYSPTGRNYSGVSGSAHTDARGNFHLAGVLPGDEVFVSATAQGYASARGPGSHSRFKAEYGKTHSIPDIVLIKMDHSVAGMVVDQRGKPMAGVEMWARAEHPLQPQILSPRPTTDSAGRFCIPDLPRGMIEVWGVLPWDRQHSTLLQRVKAGDQNARIVVEVLDAARFVKAAAGKAAPEFSVKKWLNRVTTSDGLLTKDFQGKPLLLAFLDEAKPSQRMVKTLNDLHGKHQALAIVRVYETPVAETELAKESPTAAALVEPGLIPARSSEAALKYGVSATPTLFLIDRNGILLQADADADELEKQIEELLER